MPDFDEALDAVHLVVLSEIVRRHGDHLAWPDASDLAGAITARIRQVLLNAAARRPARPPVPEPSVN